MKDRHLVRMMGIPVVVAAALAVAVNTINHRSVEWYKNQPAVAMNMAMSCRAGTVSPLDQGVLPILESNCDRAHTAWSALEKEGFIPLLVPGFTGPVNFGAITKAAAEAAR